MGANSQSEDRTHVFTVSEENGCVLLNNNTNKSDKIIQNASDKIMAASLIVSRVYVQANYQKDKNLQMTIFIQNCDSA